MYGIKRRDIAVMRLLGIIHFLFSACKVVCYCYCICVYVLYL